MALTKGIDRPRGLRQRIPTEQARKSLEIPYIIGVRLCPVFYRQGGNVGIRGLSRRGSGNGKVPFQVFQMTFPGVERTDMLPG